MQELLSAYQRNDPAAGSKAMVLLLYSGVHAVLFHKLSHWLYGHRRYFLARFISQAARHITGIEIHPAAIIGKNLVIDHGMGVVIGATARIGDDCLLYHGVTLGAARITQGKRHPTVGNGVTIGCGAKILGPISLGDGCRIGANAVVLQDIPAGATVVGVPGRILNQ
jgi:serine O-acetyltransferase